MEVSLSQIADWAKGKIVGDPQLRIIGVSSIEEAKPGEIAFVANSKYYSKAAATRASALMVKEKIDGVQSALVIVEDPYFAFAQLIAYFHPPRRYPPGIDPKAAVGQGVILEAEASIGPFVTLEEGVKIGKRVIIHSGTVIGGDGFGFAPREGKYHKIPQVGGVIIEDDVELGANVTVDRATLGNTVIGRG